MPRFSDAAVSLVDLPAAARSAARSAAEGLGGDDASFAVVLVAGGGPDEAASALEAAAQALPAGATIGARVPQALIGRGQLVSGRPAVVVWAAALPGVRVRTFHLEVLPGPEGLVVVGTPPGAEQDGLALLLADPFSFPVDGFVSGANVNLPGLPMAGALPSGPLGPGSSRLMADGRVVARGAVGVSLGGAVRHHQVVCPGARAVGPPMCVTSAEGSTVRTLAGVPAATRLEEVRGGLPPHEQALAGGGTALGLLADEYADAEDPANYVVLSVLSADRDTGEVALSAPVEVGRTVRLAVPDPQAAGVELAQALHRLAQQGSTGGALVLSAGTAPDESALGLGGLSAAVRRALGPLALAGFSSQGVLASRSGHNHVHAQTAVVVVFDA